MNDITGKIDKQIKASILISKSQGKWGEGFSSYHPI